MSKRQQYLFLDTETTGLNFGIDAIINVAIVSTDANCNVLNTFDVLIRPHSSFFIEVDKLYQCKKIGISWAMLQDQAPFHYYAREIQETLKDSIIVAHNADFDINMINAELEKISLDHIKPLEVIDTIKLAKSLINVESFSLDSLCLHFGFYDLFHERAEKGHLALLDVHILIKVFQKLQLLKHRTLPFL